jgi:hypothetical protein
LGVVPRGQFTTTLPGPTYFPVFSSTHAEKSDAQGLKALTVFGEHVTHLAFAKSKYRFKPQPTPHTPSTTSLQEPVHEMQVVAPFW